MASSPWTTYNQVPLFIGDGTIDFDTDTFKVGLYQSTSNAATLTNTVRADLTNEVAGSNGYTSGGQTLASVTWTGTTGTASFKCANPTWTASGGNITARFAVVFKSGTANSRTDPIIAYSLLDTTPADVTVTDGNVLTLVIHANGILQLAKV